MTDLESEHIRQLVKKMPKTHDTKYNTGKDHFAQGITYTEEARYFMQCEFLIQWILI